jgi:hypothetical protein
MPQSIDRPLSQHCYKWHKGNPGNGAIFNCQLHIHKYIVTGSSEWHERGTERKGHTKLKKTRKSTGTKETLPARCLADPRIQEDPLKGPKVVQGPVQDLAWVGSTNRDWQAPNLLPESSKLDMEVADLSQQRDAVARGLGLRGQRRSRARGGRATINAAAAVATLGRAARDRSSGRGNLHRVSARATGR